MNVPPKSGPGINPPTMFSAPNGQIMGLSGVGNGPQASGQYMPGQSTVGGQNVNPPMGPGLNHNGFTQQPYAQGQSNVPSMAPNRFNGPPTSTGTFSGPRTGVGPPITGPGPGPSPGLPNGPAPMRLPSAGPPISHPYGGPAQRMRPPGPPQGQLPPPPLGGVPRVNVPQSDVQPQVMMGRPRHPGSFPPRVPGPPSSVGMVNPPNDPLSQAGRPPSSAATSSIQDSGRPNELPVPYHGQGQYSHQIGPTMRLTTSLTPSNSEPTSRKSSRAPSPITSPTYDALEGQFTPNSQGSTPGYGTPPPSSNVPPSGSPGPASAGHDTSQKSGITGRRVYPQVPNQVNQQYGPPTGQQTGPGTGPQQVGGPPTQFGGPPSQPFGGPVSQPLGGPTQQFGAPPAQQFRAPPTQQFGAPPTQQFGAPPTQQFAGPPMQPGSTGQQFGGQTAQQFVGGPPTQPFGGPPGQQHFSGPPGQHLSGQPSAVTGPPSGPQQGFQAGPSQSRYPANTYQTQNVPAQGGLQQPGFPLPQVGQQIAQKSYQGSLASGFGQMSLQDNSRAVNLLQERQLIPPIGPEVPKPNLQHDFKKVNCNPEIFRCTLTSVPQTSSLLNKARLPLGILIHPFKDLSQLPVIQSSVIVRCRSCRTYINPFVYFVDNRRWKCNLCYRVNDLPDEFSFDPISKTYGEPQRRPEVRSSTIEFIAPSEYMLRPPQPAVYLFVLDVSYNAIETGYLNVFCETLLDELDKLPGDARTHIGFVAFDRAVHFFNLAEGLSQPQLLTVSDIDDIFLPSPDNLLVNIHESKDLVIDLLNQLPTLFEENKETGNALGAALQAAYKMMSATGGRVTVVQTCLPTAGPGALSAREDPNLRKSKDVQNVGPATDFYKKLALDCSAQQIAVDLFLMNGQYSDVATLACISKYSSGCIYSYPSFHAMRNPPQRDRLESDLRRYLTRKIGFEAVMRIRCTKGLSIHTFHGNFFVRSTDLLSLPNINPDAGFGMQMSIEDSLTDSPTVCFQAALLYTSSKGERRIRVHTMCLPVTNQLSEVFSGADQQTIAGLVAKMAADRTVTASLHEAREAMINVALDSLSSYGNTLTSSQRVGNLMSSFSLRLLPLYILAMLKSGAFRVGPVTKLDDRVIELERCKTLPLSRLLQVLYPDLYPVHALSDENGLKLKDAVIPQPPVLQLSSANLDRHGAFVMDTGDNIYMLVGSSISDQFCADVFDVPNFMSLEDGLHELPELENPTSERLRLFINHLIDQRPNGVNFAVLRDDSKERGLFFQHMVEDRTESTMSYYEFLQYLQKQLKGQ